MKYYTPEQPEPQTANAGTFRPIRMEQDVVVGRVSKDLYASPASGLRELLANEIRAAATAKAAGADPRIEVTVTPHMVRVWGINSLGMRRDIFDAIYMVLGRSSNFDRTVPGQFGLGRAAYTTISDHILIETSHRNGDCYAVLGVEGRGYQTGLPQPDMPYGTRVTMVPGDVDVDSMADMARKIAGRADIPVTLVTGNRAETIPHTPLGGSTCPTRITHPDVEFAVGWDAGPSYLCGMPISFRYRGRYGFEVAVDIRDERKYQPTPDRERMTEKAETAISRIIDGVVDRRMGAFPAELRVQMEHPDLPLALLMPGGTFPDLERTVTTYARPHPDDEPTTARVCVGEVGGRPVLNCTAFYRHKIDAVRALFPEAAFVKGAPELCQLDEFMASRGITARRPAAAKRAKKRPKNTVIHTARGAVRIDPDNPPASYVIYGVACKAELDEYAARTGPGMALTIHDVSGAVPIRDVINRARRHEYETTRGVMTGAQILATGLDAYPVQRRTLMECWNDGPGVEPSMLVWRDDEYDMLALASDAVRGKLRVGDWFDFELYALETYLRLDTPVLRRVLLLAHASRRGDICDDFLALEGKMPFRHDTDCRCDGCSG